MRKVLFFLFVFVLSAALIGCNGQDSANSVENVVQNLGAGNGETAVPSSVEGIPRLEVTPTPTLPATYTPPAHFAGEHLYLLPVAGAPGTRTVHIVKSGETIQSISTAYGVSPEDLRQINQIPEAASLAEGMVLVIP
ncbi:MAG: hypothetical protein Kow0080_28400 [Candidatus Promineifilaceae bacterium]